MSNTESTILVVDDVEENTLLISRMLKHDNYQVQTASNGREACDILKSERIDLVLLDINMPFIDGITVLKQKQENPALAAIPVVMLTALDDPDTALECMRIGACGFVSKPFSRHSLTQQIKFCLEKVT
ncbi:MAG: response regulator [Granulosicoccaceae bacterium]|jgi:CheY-like chemotaxis protein